MAKAKPADQVQTSQERCGNCLYWKRLAKAMGRCDNGENQIYLDTPMVRQVHTPALTPDLNVCSLWQGIE